MSENQTEGDGAESYFEQPGAGGLDSGVRFGGKQAEDPDGSEHEPEIAGDFVVVEAQMNSPCLNTSYTTYRVRRILKRIFQGKCKQKKRSFRGL